MIMDDMERVVANTYKPDYTSEEAYDDLESIKALLRDTKRRINRNKLEKTDIDIQFEIKLQPAVNLMEFDFKKFKDAEPKLSYEETIIADDAREKGVSVYVSDRIIIFHEGNYFIGRLRKCLSNYDNKVEELYVDIEVPVEKSDRVISETYIVPLENTQWSFL